MPRQKKKSENLKLKDKSSQYTKLSEMRMSCESKVIYLGFN